MAAFVVKQPNGLYCRFSTVVDCPTDWNMTEEEYIEMCVERAKERAIEEAKRTLQYHLRPFDWIEEYFHPHNMTEEEFKECLKEMGEERKEK